MRSRSGLILTSFCFSLTSSMRLGIDPPSLPIWAVGEREKERRWAPTKHDFWNGYTPIVVVDPRWSCPDLLTSFCFRQCGVDGQRNSSKLLQLPQTSAECWHGSPSLLPLSLTALLGPCTLPCHSLYCIPYFLKSRLAWRWFGFCAYYSEKGCIQMERLPKQRSEECTNG